jgi:hypothetical protein
MLPYGNQKLLFRFFQLYIYLPMLLWGPDDL